MGCLKPNNSNSSSLYTFQSIWLVEGKVLHFNEVQSRNPLDLFFFRHLKKFDFFGNICNIFVTKDLDAIIWNYLLFIMDSIDVKTPANHSQT